MRRRICLLGACCFFWASISPLQAQAPADPAVTIVHGGVDLLYSDLQIIFVDLAKDPKNFATLKDTLDVFFDGVDPARPALLEVFVRSGQFKTVLHVPTPKSGPTAFKNNLRALGFTMRTLARNLFALGGLMNGFLQQNPDTSVIAEDRGDAQRKVDIAKVAAKYGVPKHHVVAMIENDKDVAGRKKAVQKVREEVMPGLKQLAKETADEFALRKLTIEQQFEEIEQIFSESQKIQVTGSVEGGTAPALVSQTTVVPLPQTDFEKIIGELASEPSVFAGIAHHKELPLSSMMNYRLDKLRQDHVVAFLKKSRPMIVDGIRKRETTDEKSREYLALTVDIIFDVLDKAAADGKFDSFAQVLKHEDGLHTLVGGIKVEGAVVLKGLEKVKEVTTVQLDAEKAGDFALHQIKLPGNLTELQKVFGKEAVLWVATSESKLMYSVGEKSLEELKAAITKAEEKPAQPSPFVVQLHVQAGLWMDLFDAIRDKKHTGNDASRQLAVDAFKAGGDTVDFSMERENKTLVLKLNLGEGILRYVGKAGSKFVKENLN